MKRGYKKGYKVVLRGSRKSVIVGGTDTIQYKIRRFVRHKAGCGPLCVFEHLTQAQEFAAHAHNEVWECEYYPSRRKYIWLIPIHKVGMTFLPEGTRLATQVKLVKRVL